MGLSLDETSVWPINRSLEVGSVACVTVAMYVKTSMHNANLKQIFVVCSVLTTVGSVAAAGMLGLAFLGVGWDSVLFDSLLAVTVVSTFGLITGTVGLLTRRKWPIVVLIFSTAYIPVAFLSLTLFGSTPPSGWWPLLPVSLIEIALGGISSSVGHTVSRRKRISQYSFCLATVQERITRNRNNGSGSSLFGPRPRLYCRVVHCWA